MHLRFVVPLGVACAACGGSSNNNAHDASGGSDAGGVDAHTGSGTMLVRVVVQNAVTGSGALPGLAGAAIDVDVPGGEHRQLTTGSDGSVLVDGIDFSLGAASVLASAPGFTVAGAVNLSPDTFDSLPKLGSGDVVLRLFEQDLAELPVQVTVFATFGSADTGAFVGMDPGEGIAFLGNQKNQPVELRSALHVPLTIVTAELATGSQTPVRWAEISEPALTANTNLQIDVGSGGTTLASNDSQIAVFRPASGPLAAGTPELEMTSTDSELLLGGVTARGSATGSGELDLTTNWVSVSGFDPLSIAFLSGDGSAFSEEVDSGSDAFADRTITFVDAPAAPASATAASIPVGSPPDGAVVSLIGLTPDTTTPVHIDVPPGTTSFALPTFPSTVTAPASWQLGYSEDFLDDVREFHQSQASETFELQ